jgi:DNA-binding winged helix-turn-helix (wHTH) protein
MTLHFGDFKLDGDTRQLLRARRVIHLSPKAFELLQVLTENRPRAVSKAVLQKRLWPETFASEANLPNLVSEIRHALSDSTSRPRFVRTVHGFGYAFCGLADEDAEERTPTRSVVSYWLAWEKVTIPLMEGENIVGREPGVNVWFDLPSVSRRHARIFIRRDRVTIEDLGSKNGTFVRGKPLTSPLDLGDGDELQIGSLVMRFRAWSAEAPTQTHVRTYAATASTRRANSPRR